MASCGSKPLTSVLSPLIKRREAKTVTGYLRLGATSLHLGSVDYQQSGLRVASPSGEGEGGR
jgi:hypothetical protein